MAVEVSSGKPYHDFNLMTDQKLRLFREDVKEEQLIWHRDLSNREVRVEDGVGWKLQMDNELPVDLVIGEKYNIPKMTYHRLIKGKGNLVLRIQEI